jgi:tellurite resistance protein
MGHHIWSNGPTVRSRVSRGMTGRRSGQDVPEIPYKKGFWANYGWQTLISLAVCQGALITLVTGFQELAAVGGVLYLGFLTIVIIGSAAAPLWFWSSYRDLDRVFGDVEDHKPVVAPTLIKEHPNPTVLVDGTHVVTAGVVLLVLGLADLLFGYAMVFGGLRPAQANPLIWRIFGIYQLVEGAAVLGLGVATLFGKVRATGLAFFLMLAGWGTALPTLNNVPIVVRAAAAVLVWRGLQSLREINNRVIEPEKEDALTVYYHNLLAILVWVMRADGQCDRREKAKMTNLLDTLHLSRYERDVVISGASHGERPTAIEATVRRYLEAAESLGMAGPDLHLVSAALIVAGADGVLHPEEAAAIGKVGGWLGMEAEEVDALLEQHAASLDPDAIDGPWARALLNLDADASLADAEAALEAYTQEYHPDRFGHLGSSVADHAARRLTAVTRAYEVLQAQPTANGSQS